MAKGLLRQRQGGSFDAVGKCSRRRSNNVGVVDIVGFGHSASNCLHAGIWGVGKQTIDHKGTRTFDELFRSHFFPMESRRRVK